MKTINKETNLNQDYFDFETLKEFKDSFGKQYTSKSQAAIWYKDTFEKIKNLMNLFNGENNIKLSQVYTEKLNTQPNRNGIQKLKTYVLRGYSTKDKYDGIFIKIEFRDLNSDSPKLILEFDKNRKPKNESPYDTFLNSSEKNKYFYSYQVDEYFPKDYQELIIKIKNDLINMINKMRQLQGDEISNKNMLTNKAEGIRQNIILYGPPGTGKTYNSISHSVAIIENKSIDSIIEEGKTNREEIKSRFDKYVSTRQIVFCTFHQSISYEDFIEGIKPIEPDSEEESLSYAVEDGIFKKLCTEAAFSFVSLRVTKETEKVLDFSSAYDQYVDSVNDKFARGEKVEIETRNGGKILIESISPKNNISVRHIDGNRKYSVSKKRLSKISQAYPDLNVLTNINNQFRAEIGGSNSSAYWAVLHAIRNHSPEDTFQSLKSFSEKDYSYDDQKEIISIMEKSDFQTNNPKNYVMIIDEINRGNVSQIFGELITLIEEDKRLGMTEALRTKLPYSKEHFGVPPNLSIIGTMNTADRSVEALDTALRRRFSFIPMMPDESILKDTEDGISLSKILTTLNLRLSVLKDNDHTIGHAWLCNISDIETLKTVFRDKILPLLQEYFFNDYEKLGLVLGDAFFKPHKQISSNLFATFTGGNGLAGQYDQTWQYQLKSADELTIADFKSLEQLKYQPKPDEA